MAMAIKTGNPMASADDAADEIAGQAFALMKDLINLTGEKWVSAQRFSAMADRWELNDAQARITFLTGVKGLLRDMPEKVFPDLDQRQSIISAAQEALDAAIELEEEQE